MYFVGDACKSRTDVPSIFAGQKVPSAVRSTRTSHGIGARALVAGDVGKEDASASPLDGDDRPSSAGILDATLGDHFYSKRSADLLERNVQKQLSQLEALESKLMRARAELAICKKNLSQCIMCFVNLSKDATNFKFYTGISVEVFCDVENILAASTSNMDYAGRKSGAHGDGSRLVNTRNSLTHKPPILMNQRMAHAW